jgi:hypothetical protein
VAIYNAIQKYGWENFQKDWYECPDGDLDKHEELMIEVLGTLSPGGYNLKGGGSNGKPSEETKRKMREAQLGEKNHAYGKMPSEETKQKMSEINIGKIVSEETKKKLREANIGKTLSEEHKQKISEANTGKIRTEEVKQKLGDARLGEKNNMYGKTHTKEAKQKMSESKKGKKSHRSKKVYQYDTEGNFIRSFESCEEASFLFDKKDASNIRVCARGRGTTAYGFKWSYTKL